ncbi:MAG TPA: RimK family protein [Pseudomonadales bacterium]|nr:RimK family protein [Pseudomonadales bacterium]
MSRLLIVIDKLEDWRAFYPSEDVISAQDYIQNFQTQERVQVINLCKRYKYLGIGYYVSLLAEARGHRVMPSVKTLSDLNEKAIFSLLDEDFDKQLSAQLGSKDGLQFTCKAYFGQTDEQPLREVARQIFERYPIPVMEISVHRKGNWRLQSIQLIGLSTLDDAEETAFANSLDYFSSKVWRPERPRQTYRYDLAMLVNPKEVMAPSNEAALRKFEKAGKKCGILVERIGKKDLFRLAEYDALFIRETTAVPHHTYRFARKAASEGMVVIDDPESILKCTNKIYLASLLTTHKLPSPKTLILNKTRSLSLKSVIEDLGLPIVLKIPDGSFSIGVTKSSTMEELEKNLEDMFEKSALVLAQEYIYTDFDWRIGILNNQPLYACRYYMAKKHWQIYHHEGNKTKSGDFDTLPTYEAPDAVIKAALDVCKRIGTGFYGVDIKQKGDKVFIIEVNDNPSVEAGVEDDFLKDKLYELIMGEFRRRLDAES